MFLYNYLKLTSWCGFYYFYPSDLVYDIILKNIQDCGCVVIKFTQWLLPRIETIYDIDSEKDLWFKKLEEFYEYNLIHDIKYTKKLFKKSFNKEIEDVYEIEGVIGSGSIGQVYKAKNKASGEYHALKVVHPNLSSQIIFFKFIFWIIMNIKFIRDIYNKYLPFNLFDFIGDFENQKNMVYEGNNCIHFYQNYKDNKCIIIPEVLKVSENILIMTYENGVKFEDFEASDYLKYKCVLLLYSLIKNNYLVKNFNHGDIHKGNWKVKKDENNNVYLILLDFGFCWGVENDDFNMVRYMEDAFLYINKDHEKDKKVFTKITRFLLDNGCSEDLIIKKLDILKERVHAEVLMRLAIEIAKEEKIIIKKSVLQMIILLTQSTKNFETYHLLKHDAKELAIQGYTGYEFFRRRSHDIISFCEVNNIFSDYVQYISKQISEYNPEISDLFETIEKDYIDKDIDFKELALNAVS